MTVVVDTSNLPHQYTPISTPKYPCIKINPPCSRQMNHITLSEPQMEKVDFLIKNMMNGTRGLLRDSSTALLSLDAEHRRMLEWIEVRYCVLIVYHLLHHSFSMIFSIAICFGRISLLIVLGRLFLLLLLIICCCCC